MGREIVIDNADDSKWETLSNNTRLEKEVGLSNDTVSKENPEFDTGAATTIPALDTSDDDPELPPSSLVMDGSIPAIQISSADEGDEITETQIEYRYVVQYVDREVIKEVPVEKSMALRYFNSLDELETWLATDDTNEYIHLFAGSDGVCQPSDRYDCDDYAFQLQRRAASSGFLISVTIIKQMGKSHMINLACIDNDIYYIEPQTDEVWFFCNLD